MWDANVSEHTCELFRGKERERVCHQKVRWERLKKGQKRGAASQESERMTKFALEADAIFRAALLKGKRVRSRTLITGPLFECVSLNTHQISTSDCLVLRSLVTAGTATFTFYPRRDENEFSQEID